MNLTTNAHSNIMRDSRRLIISNIFDAVAGSARMMVLDATAVIAVRATALQLGTLNAAGTIAFLLLGVPIGLTIDRTNPRIAMIIAGFMRALLYAILAVVFARGQYSFWLLAVVSLLAGILVAVSGSGQTVWAAKIAPKGQVGSLIAKISAADNVVMLLVPALAGFALAVFQPYALIAASAALWLYR